MSEMSFFDNVTEHGDVASSIPQIWAKAVLREHNVRGFWPRFAGGEGSGKPIIQKTELLNKPGDLIHIQVTGPLTEDGKRGDLILPTNVDPNEGAKLVGYEESLASSSIKVVPELLRHAVRWNRRTNKKSILQLRAEARMRISEWGMTKQDRERFDLLTRDVDLGDDPPAPGEDYTPNYHISGGLSDMDSIAAGADSGVLTVEDCQRIKLALVTSNEPGKRGAKPVQTVEGEPVYFLVTTPAAAYHLKRDPEYQNYVSLARERSRTNPLFTGALAMIDGLVIYEHMNVPVVENANGVNVAKGIAFGAEFAVEGLDEGVSSNAETFDYGLEFGISYEFAFQPRRALELSSVQVRSRHTIGAV